MKTIRDVEHIYYINLKERPDRKSQVEDQLKSIGVTTAKRFEAIRLPNGRLGCSMSHLAIIKRAKLEDWNHVMVVEDDIFFLNPDLFIKQFNSFLSHHSHETDVVLLCGNNLPPYLKIDNYCIRVHFCQTTTGYLIFNHYFDTLIKNIEEGIQKLTNEPHLHILYAIDKFWISLQKKDRWFLIIPPTVIQKPDYSNIEKKETDFSNMFLDLDKSWLFMKR